VIGVVAGYGDPNVGDEARTIFVEQSERFAGGYGPRVGIPSAAVVAGGTVLDVVLGLRERGKLSAGILGQERDR
jgi:hypothetical protein